MSLSNTSQIKKIEHMSDEEKNAYFASGRVTLGKYTELKKDKTTKTWYVAKVRGVVVGNPGEWKHETPEAAIQYGRKILAEWKADLLAKRKS